MNGVLSRAWLVGLMLVAPGLSFAQTTPPAETPPAVTEPAPAPTPGEAKAEDDKKEEEKKDEAAPAEATPAPAPTEAAPAPTEAAPAPTEVAPAPVPEAAPAEKAVEATPAEVKASGMPEAPAATPTAAAPSPGNTAAPGAPAAGTEGDGQGRQMDDKKTSTQLGAAAPVPPDTGRPWQIFTTLEANVGAGTFIADPNARQDALGWSFLATGFYKITNLFGGRVDALAQVGWDQAITNNATNFGTRPNEFFMRDIRLAVAGRGLYTEEFTGIVFGSSINTFLPTSKFSQAQERILRGAVNVTAARMFTEVGPGNLLVNFLTSVRKDFGPPSVTLDAEESASRFATCRSSNLTDDGNGCASNIGTFNWAWTNSLSATYFLGDFSAALSFGVVSQYAHDLRDLSESPSSVAASPNVVIGRSQYAGNEAAYSTLTTSSLSIGYLINDNINLGLGFATLQSPIIQDGSNSSRLKFPFFDFESTANNLSSFFLDLNVQY